jgi:hypothetical protein
LRSSARERPMRDFIARCSSLSRLMTEPRSKSDGPLSVGAKTAVREMARAAIFGVEREFSSRETEKGTLCEPDSISLYNSVFFTDHTKNEERRTVGLLTGEPDIVADSEGVDIKTSWSMHTFPIALVDAVCPEYEWQARGYMKLFDKPRWKIAYCLVDTPEHLIGYENEEAHMVSHIPEHLRVTVWTIERDAAKEASIDVKLAAARDYYAEVLREFDRMHGGEEIKEAA